MIKIKKFEHAIVLIALILILYQLPSSCFFNDDYLQLSIMENQIQDYGSAPFNLFKFFSGEPGQIHNLKKSGPLPWFAHPRLKIYFFRPLSSVLISLEHLLFGLSPLGYQVHAMLLYLIFISILSQFFHGIIFLESNQNVNLAAVIAALIYTVSPMATVLFGSMAAHHYLFVILFLLISLTAYLKWRVRSSRSGLFIAIIAYCLGLSAGEASLGLLLYLCAYEVAVPKDTWMQRLFRLSPMLLITIIYLMIYFGMGCGVDGSDHYLNPLSMPFDYFKELPARLLIMVADLSFGIKPALWYIESKRLITIIIGSSAFGVILMVLVPAWHSASKNNRATILWMGLGTIGNLLILAMAPPVSARLLLPMIGFAVLLGFIFKHWWGILRHGIKISVLFPILVCFVLFYIHLIKAPCQWFRYPAQRYSAALNFTTEVHSFNILTRPHQKIIFLNHPGKIGFYGYFMRKLYQLPLPDQWWPLSIAPYQHKYIRSGPNELTLEIMDGQMMGSFTEKALRTSHLPLKKGDQYNLPGLKIKIVNVNKIGPTKIKFLFDRHLEDPNLCFAASIDNCLQQIKPPLYGQVLYLPKI